MLLVYFSLAWLAGIFLGRFLHLPIWTPAFALLPLVFVLFFRGHKKQFVIFSVCLLSLFAGIVRYDDSLPTADDYSLPSYHDNDVVEIRGTVVAAPDIRDTYTQLTIKATGVNTGADWQPVAGKVLVFASIYPAYGYGDILQIKGSLSSPAKLDEFDYPGYLANQGIFSTMAFPDVTLIDTGKWFTPLGWIYELRQVFAQKIAQVLPEPQASLAQGILLGMRGNISQSLKDNFTITGTTHILAISGVNLNIVAGILLATGIWLFGKRRGLYIWLALAAIWAYSLLTGFDPPVVRAAFMVSLFLFADLLGRQHSILTALASAAAVMTALTPRVLWDISFQLSFLAMLALIYIVPPLQSSGKTLVSKISRPDSALTSVLSWITDSFAVTLGVTIVVWPLIAYYFGVFSLVSPFATLLILPALPAIMLFSALAALLGLFFTPLGIAFGWVAWLFLSYMLWLVDGFARLPAAALPTGSLHPLIIVGYFGLLAALMLILRYYHKFISMVSLSFDFFTRVPKKWLLPPLITLVLLSAAFGFTLPDDKLHVSYLDVGQGDAILIQIGNQDILIDGGPSAAALNRELGKHLPFWNRTLELVIVTHPHADHLTGLIDTLDKYRVEQVLEPLTASASPLWLEWTALIEKRAIKTTQAATGQKVNLNNHGITIEVLHAPSSGDAATLDDEGIVLKLSAGRVSFLFTADITAATEMELIMARAHLTSTVLKVAHHGSETATTGEFLSVVKPSLAIISVGANSDYGHPTRDTLSRLAGTVGQEHIYRTDLNGTIELTTDGERLWLTEDR